MICRHNILSTSSLIFFATLKTESNVEIWGLCPKRIPFLCNLRQEVYNKAVFLDSQQSVISLMSWELCSNHSLKLYGLILRKTSPAIQQAKHLFITTFRRGQGLESFTLELRQRSSIGWHILLWKKHTRIRDQFWTSHRGPTLYHTSQHILNVV